MSSWESTFKKPLMRHPIRVKNIVLENVVLCNILRADRGAGGQLERDFEDEDISYVVVGGDAGGVHDRNLQTVPRSQGIT